MPAEYPGVIPMISYEDGIAALDWLAQAFGFRERARQTWPDGRLSHGEMEAGDGLIMLATPTPDYESPRRHRQTCEQARKWSAVPWIIDGVLVYVDDLDAHYQRAQRQRAPQSCPNPRTDRLAGVTGPKTWKDTAGSSCSETGHDPSASKQERRGSHKSKTRLSSSPMATWEEFAVAAPELATFGAKRLEGRVAYLATLRADGGPRVHPITPHTARGYLFVYMEPTSPKAHDLRRDSRYSLHCSVEDTSGGEGEFSLRGQAQIIDDPTARAALFAAAKAAGYHPQDHYVVFALSVESASSTIYKGGEPIRKRWRED